MNYVILDLEWDRGKDEKNRIIELAAVRLDKTYNIIDTYQGYVHTDRLSKRAKKIVTTNREKMSSGFRFSSTVNNFKYWLNQHKSTYMLLSWGREDERVLRVNCEYVDISTDWIVSIRDLQLITMNYLKLTQAIGLKNAVEFFQIETSREFHTALNDCLYCAEIIKKIKPNFKEIVELSKEQMYKVKSKKVDND